jgi:hypothetical protein
MKGSDMSETPRQPPADLAWRKSRASASGNCVEVAAATDTIYVRDSKAPSAGFLSFTTAEWNAFLVGVDRGEFTITTLQA